MNLTLSLLDKNGRLAAVTSCSTTSSVNTAPSLSEPIWFLTGRAKMFKQLLTLTIIALVTVLASPCFASSASFQLSVTIPPHIMPNGQFSGIGQEQSFNNTSDAPQLAQQQITQREEITRNNQTVTVESVVVL